MAEKKKTAVWFYQWSPRRWTRFHAVTDDGTTLTTLCNRVVSRYDTVQYGDRVPHWGRFCMVCQRRMGKLYQAVSNLLED